MKIPVTKNLGEMEYKFNRLIQEFSTNLNANNKGFTQNINHRPGRKRK